MQEQAELAGALRSALQACASPWAQAPLEPLRDKGLAHAHVRLCGTGVLARIPKQSQIGLPAQANLLHQRACFERAAASGHTPRLLGWLPVSRHLPRGALLVEEIEGRPAQLPGDLDALAAALAAMHALPLPEAARRAPLADPPDPLQALAAEITQQAVHLPVAHIAPAVQAAIAGELQALRVACARPDRPPRCLIAFDGHPGNFIVRPEGQAVLVDLEKCRYSHPGLDLAHATLYTSTTWDLESHCALTPEQVLQSYAAWQACMGPAGALARPWQGPLRRAMWLWSITWCAKWRALSGQAAKAGADGEDWSAEHSDAALVRHVRGRVDHYLDAGVVARMLEEFDALEAALR
jgi:hypothetical protein